MVLRDESNARWVMVFQVSNLGGDNDRAQIKLAVSQDCVPRSASPRTLAACCSLTFAWRVIRSLLRLLLSSATSGPCRRTSLPRRTRLVFELHCAVAPTTSVSLHVLLSMRQHLLASLGVAYRTSKDFVTWSERDSLRL